MRRRTASRRTVLTVDLFVLLSVVASIVLPVGPGSAATSSSKPAFAKTENLSRIHLVNGADQVVDTRTFTVSVDITSHLRDRQEINVTWSGAHPTGGLIGDENSGDAAQEEYPVVLMECRGVDVSSAPASQRLSPQTCWTHTPAERTQYDQFTFPPFRIDRYATQADRRQTVGVPSPVPDACAQYNSGAQHWTPFKAVDGTVYEGGPFGCAGMPPEAVNVESTQQPSNTTYGASDLNGNGSAKFAIATAETNASLGCSDKVACSLVIVPIMGISCDPTGEGLPQEDQPQGAADTAFARCSGKGNFAPGQYNGIANGQEDVSVSGLLWWSASNWRNHVSVPLDFSQPANICQLVNNSAPVYVYGSELMTQATLQWAPAFCLNPKLFKFQHVQTSEPEAKNLLQNGSVQAALQGAPPEAPFSRPVVQAPVALTGFAIVYAIDDQTHHAYHKLKLNPRLLAKLMTESYPGLPSVKGDYAALSQNPVNLAEDPEFRALNPILPPAGYNTPPAATLFSIASDSDVMWALTSYIQADPEARAWLNGKPDPWGMVVNPNYKGIKLPVAGWPLMDTWQSGTVYDQDHNPCLNQSPVPFLPLVAAPVSTLAQLTLNMQFDIANSQIVCANAGFPNQKLVSMGRQNPGQLFMVGVTSLADAARYQLDTAALQTHITSTAPVKFADTTGRTFVTPSDASLRAAARLLKSDEKMGTWLVPYSTMRTDAAGAGAYPGTMLVSIDVPTTGLRAPIAQRYASLLRFMAGSGQTPGFGNGQLPPGYLPMTAANGLGSQAAYTVAAAAAVAVQSQGVPSVVTLKVPGTSTSGGTTGDLSHVPAPTIVPSSAPSQVVAAVNLPPKQTFIARLAGWALGIATAGFAGLALPLVLMIAVGSGLVGVSVWLVWRRMLKT